MSAALVLVVVFSAVALGLSAFALWVAWGARTVAREAHDGVRSLASASARRRRQEREQRADPSAVDEREVDLGPPEPAPERRQEDLGPRARHRAPEPERYSRLRASSEVREQRDEPTTAIPRADAGEPELPATAEHPAPTGMFRRPPPPLPPPGSITRPRS